MDRVLQTAPISDMSKDQANVLSLLNDGPLLLMQRSTPAAVMVTPEVWNGIADELEALRHQVLCDWVVADADIHPERVRVVSGKDEWMALLDE